MHKSTSRSQFKSQKTDPPAVCPKIDCPTKIATSRVQYWTSQNLETNGIELLGTQQRINCLADMAIIQSEIDQLECLPNHETDKPQCAECAKKFRRIEPKYYSPISCPQSLKRNGIESQETKQRTDEPECAECAKIIRKIGKKHCSPVSYPQSLERADIESLRTKKRTDCLKDIAIKKRKIDEPELLSDHEIDEPECVECAKTLRKIEQKYCSPVIYPQRLERDDIESLGTKQRTGCLKDVAIMQRKMDQPEFLHDHETDEPECPECAKKIRRIVQKNCCPVNYPPCLERSSIESLGTKQRTGRLKDYESEESACAECAKKFKRMEQKYCPPVNYPASTQKYNNSETDCKRIKSVVNRKTLIMQGQTIHALSYEPFCYGSFWDDRQIQNNPPMPDQYFCPICKEFSRRKRQDGRIYCTNKHNFN